MEGKTACHKLMIHCTARSRKSGRLLKENTSSEAFTQKLIKLGKVFSCIHKAGYNPVSLDDLTVVWNYKKAHYS
jgi:hypothetical protein